MSERHADDNCKFNYAKMDWEHYTAHRPAYPAQLYDLIYDYHKSHGGSFGTALDVGGGNGIVTREFLLQKFSHATFSDPSELYVSQARSSFASIEDPKQLSFLTGKLEDIKPSDLDNGPVDLITAATCLHWMNALKVAPSAAPLLKPGGTFSAWCYGGRPVVPAGHEDAQKAWLRIFLRFIEIYELKLGYLVSDDGTTANMNARFDNVPFDPEQWENVRRIKVLPQYPMFEAPKNYSSRTLPEESQEVLDDAFISRNADYEWMEGYLQSLLPPIDIRVEMAEELKELKTAVGDGEMTLRWPFAIVLATRK